MTVVELQTNQGQLFVMPADCKPKHKKGIAELDLQLVGKVHVSAAGLAARFTVTLGWAACEDRIVTEQQWQRLRSLALKGSSEPYWAESDQIFLVNMFPMLFGEMGRVWDYDSMFRHLSGSKDHSYESVARLTRIGAQLGMQLSPITDDRRMVYLEKGSSEQRLFDLFCLQPELDVQALVRGGTIVAIVR